MMLIMRGIVRGIDTNPSRSRRYHRRSLVIPGHSPLPQGERRFNTHRDCGSRMIVFQLIGSVQKVCDELGGFAGAGDEKQMSVVDGHQPRVRDEAGENAAVDERHDRIVGPG